MTGFRELEPTAIHQLQGYPAAAFPGHIQDLNPGQETSPEARADLDPVRHQGDPPPQAVDQAQESEQRQEGETPGPGPHPLATPEMEPAGGKEDRGAKDPPAEKPGGTENDLGHRASLCDSTNGDRPGRYRYRAPSAGRSLDVGVKIKHYRRHVPDRILRSNQTPVIMNWGKVAVAGKNAQHPKCMFG